jgi:hypothetical protein
MPTPTIPAGNLFMNATLYTGNSGTQSIVNGVAGQAFQPDFVWLKSRSNALDNGLYDSVRGIQKDLGSNSTGAENYGGTGELTAFNSNGFTLVNSGNYQTNQSGYTYVGWQWKAGGTATTIAVGSISSGVPSVASSVSANTTSGFSIVTWTGTSAVSATIGHGLGVAPKFVIIKQRTPANAGLLYDWNSYHASLGADYFIGLNATGGATSYTVADLWSRTNPSNTVITLGSSVGTGATGYNVNNYSGTTYVAYCWAEIAGFSKFGSYTGNGSTDGPFIYTGFRPKFVLMKASSSTSNWTIIDTSRDTYNYTQYGLYPNLSNSESNPGAMDILSNGLKIRSTFTDVNGSGTTYIYMAFAENPFKYANAR